MFQIHFQSVTTIIGRYSLGILDIVTMLSARMLIKGHRLTMSRPPLVM